MLVEGKDDQHVIGHLLAHYNINCVPAERTKLPKDEQIVIKETGGIEQLLSNLEIYLDDGNVKRLAVVVDADVNISSRWSAICNVLTKSGSTDLSFAPSPNGTLINVQQMGRELMVGIWVMPDNQNSGMLEDFMKQLVPENDNLWGYAVECVAGLGNRCRFPIVRKSKAEIHTWLAWQNEPGRPFGVAIAANYLQVETNCVRDFTNWVREVFAL